MTTNHVSLTIAQDIVGVSRKGFGVPMILSHSAAWAERTRVYSDLVGVGADFATDSPEYLQARAILSQTPKPEKIKIGRAANIPTMEYRITPTAANSTAYAVGCSGEGVTAEEVSFTSDATATVAEITAGLFAAINTVTGKNFTAVDDTTHVTITGDAAGDWFALELGSIANMSIEQRHADPGLSADISAISLEDDDWYCLLTHFNSDLYCAAATAHIEAVKKIYLADSCNTDSVTTVAGNGDYLDDLATVARARTAGIYSQSPSEFLAAAWAGRCLSADPGSITWKFKTLSGPTPSSPSLTGTHRANLEARNANFYENVAGRNIMANGTTGDGDFIDVQRAIDWLDDEIRKAVFEHLASGGKVPFTDAGVTVITSAIAASLQIGVNRGVLSDDPEPVVTAPLVKDISVADKTSRTLPDVKFSAVLAGAIHKVKITGVVSV